MKKKSIAKGRLKEQKLARHLIQKGWKILFQNKKFSGVEIDLLAEKGQNQILIEVKSITKEENLEKLFKDKQKQRLKKVLESLSEDFPNLRLFLATVDRHDRFEFFEIS